MVRSSFGTLRAKRRKVVYGYFTLFVLVVSVSAVAGGYTATLSKRPQKEPPKEEIGRKVIQPERIMTLPDGTRIGLPPGFSVTEKKGDMIVMNPRNEKRIRIAISTFRSTFGDKDEWGWPVWERAPRRWDKGPPLDEFKRYSATVFNSVFTDSVFDWGSVEANDGFARVVAHAKDMSYFRIAYLASIDNGKLCLIVYSFQSALDIKTNVRAAQESVATILSVTAERP